MSTLRKHVLLALSLMSPNLIAAPFLTCNQYLATGPQPTEFMCSIDGGEDIVTPAADRAGGKVMMMDLQSVPFGSHKYSCAARNATVTSPRTVVILMHGLLGPEGLIVIPGP